MVGGEDVWGVDDFLFVSNAPPLNDPLRMLW